MDLNVTAYSRLDDPRLVEAWSALDSDARDTSIFRTHVWCSAWASNLGSAFEPLVLVASANGAPVGLLPLCVDASGSVRWLKFLGSDRVRGDHLGIVCRTENHDAVAEACLNFLLQFPRKFDGLLLDGVPVDSSTHVALRRWSKQNSFRTVDREIQTLPYIELPPTFDEYLATLSHKRRNALRRSRRKLEGSGAQVVLNRGDDLDRVIKAFCELHAQRWNAVGAASNFADPSMRGFLKEFCTRAVDRGWFRAYLLTVGGKTEGVLLAFHFQDAASFYQIARDPNSTVLNAGMMLIAASIEQTIEESMARFDFLRGDESYKSRLAKSQSLQATVMIGMRGAAKAAVAKERLAQRLKKTANRLLGDDRWSQLKQRLGRAKACPAPPADQRAES